jgi:hypothetical protein
VTPLPTTHERNTAEPGGIVSPPQDLAARRLRRLARLLRQTGRPAEAVAAEHIAALLEPSNVRFLRDYIDQAAPMG